MVGAIISLSRGWAFKSLQKWGIFIFLKITCVNQGLGSARDMFCGSDFILQMDHDIILLFSKCYENT